jgi:hypothetical protein
MSEVMTRPVNQVVIADQQECCATEESGAAAAVVVRRSQRGMVSAEWAVGLIAAIAVAGVLLAVVTTGSVKQALLGIILKIISTMAGG